MAKQKPAISPRSLIDFAAVLSLAPGHSRSVNFVFSFSRNPTGPATKFPTISPLSFMSSKDVKPKSPLEVGISMEVKMYAGVLLARSVEKTPVGWSTNMKVARAPAKKNQHLLVFLFMILLRVVRHLLT